MKKFIFRMTLLGIAYSTIPAQAADPVSLNVTGNIIASPCQVDSDSVNKQVDLGQNIQASSLKNAGTASDWINFDLKVVSCPAGTTKATITMHGNSDPKGPDDLYLSSGSASNVAVQVQMVSGEQMGDGKSFTGTIVNNAYTYNMRARAYTVDGGVTPGTISSVVTATFVYQ